MKAEKQDVAVQKEDRKGFAASPEKEPKSRGEKPVSARRVLFLLSYQTPGHRKKHLRRETNRKIWIAPNYILSNEQPGSVVFQSIPKYFKTRTSGVLSMLQGRCHEYL